MAALELDLDLPLGRLRLRAAGQASADAATTPEGAGRWRCCLQQRIGRRIGHVRWIKGDLPGAIEAMQEVGEEESMKLEHRLSYLALIGTISPMVGLFGTVEGMIRSFKVIATEGGTPDPSKLA